MPIKLIRSLAAYAAVLSPEGSGYRVAVIDQRNCSEVSCPDVIIRGSVGDAWGDVIINGARLRIPVQFSEVARHGGHLLSDRENQLRKPYRRIHRQQKRSVARAAGFRS